MDSPSSSISISVKEDSKVELRNLAGRNDVTDAKPNRNSHMRSISSGGLFNRNSTKTDSVRLPVDRDAPEYNMGFKKRGLACIFNHEIFDEDTALEPRLGTRSDCHNLEQTLKNLSFDVVVFHDLSYDEIQEKVEKLSKVDHNDHDCLLISILSYGHFGHIYAKDKPYQLEQIWEHFTADNCISLAGKPKIFLIQACAREQLTIRSRRTLRLHYGTTETDSSDTNATFKIPIHADFLIVYSTIPGTYSWSNTEKGCWFVQCLCHELRNEDNCEILDKLTFVNQRISNLQNTVPCVKTMLTRFLYFRKKSTND